MAGVNPELNWINHFDWEKIFRIDFVKDSGSEGDEKDRYTEEGKFLLVNFN